MRKIRGSVYAADNYGSEGRDFTIEVPDSATYEEIQKAVEQAALEECNISWEEVEPPKPRKPKEAK